MKQFWEYLLVSEVIFFSGGMRFCAAHPRECMIIFLLTSIYYFIKYSNKNLYIITSNTKTMMCIGSWVFLTTKVFSNDCIDNTYFQYILYPVGICVLMSSMSLKDFKNKLLFCFNVLLFFSVLAQFSHDVFGVRGQTDTMGVYRSEMLWYFFNVQTTGQGHRLSSIYWEPGQLQIVCFFVLILFFNDLCAHLKDVLYSVKRYGLIILSLLYSFSTAAYLCLLVFVCTVMYVIFSKKNKLLFPVTIIISGLFSYYLFTSDVVASKFDANNDNYTSYEIRQADNYALLQVSIENPIVGAGINTKKLNSRLFQLDDTTSSNGWLRLSAMCGFPYLLFILLVMLNRCITLFGNKLESWILMSILFLSQCNEATIFFPCTYLYVFRFNDFLYMKKNSNYSVNGVSHAFNGAA